MTNYELFIKEGLKRTSQNNFNQAEAGYNAKWFKRGAIFGYETVKKQIELHKDITAIDFFNFVKKNYTEINGLYDLKNTPYWSFNGKNIKELLVIFKVVDGEKNERKTMEQLTFFENTT